MAAGFVREQQAQRLLYRGAFSVGNPAGGASALEKSFFMFEELCE